MLKRSLFIAIAIFYGLILLDLYRLPPVAPERSRLSTIQDSSAGTQAVFRQQYVNLEGATPRVHAPTAMINARGEMHSYWYGGTREGAEDVAIYGARFDRLTDTWVDHRKIIDRVSASKQSNRWVRKIGNPVAFGHPDGRVWLFYVNVSVGGWAWSAINLATSNDGGMTFGGDKRLVTSPFFNRSTLVKSPALELADGTIGLPVHHQLLSKHGEMLKLNNDGAVIDKRRIPSKLPALQPALVKMPDGSLLAFLRNGAEDQRMLLRSTSYNWGLSWSSATNADIPNPNSAVAVTSTPGGLLLAFNNDPKNRDVLSLAHSTDEGKSWRILHVLEYQPNLHEHDHSNEFSYPWFVQDDNGFYHLFYTWQRTFIKHVQFNNAWLEQQLGVDG